MKVVLINRFNWSYQAKSIWKKDSELINEKKKNSIDIEKESCKLLQEEEKFCAHICVENFEKIK